MSITLSYASSHNDASDVGPLIARGYMSVTYLEGAALFAKKAYEIETRPEIQDPERGMGLVERPEHHAYTSAAILMSALTIEAFINELFADCALTEGDNLFGLDAARAKKLGEVWKERSTKRVPKLRTRRGKKKDKIDLTPLGAVEKYGAALKILLGKGLDSKSETVKDARTLVELRNTLAHYKLVYRQFPDSDTRVEKIDPDEEPHVQAPGLDRADAAPDSFVEDTALKHSVAEWSVKTALAFILNFKEALHVNAQFPGAWPTEALLRTR
ncbi:hypothetical protein QZL74_36590 (plasmid) [Burkholderia gladioli pv. alliicola]|uniref:hypothetical protein n=1 Tax=Burkholderia gladioli TaxID=28095 RepID=UPI000FD6E9AF|nr:hypothetical protein [Burkholderia gladioli]